MVLRADVGTAKGAAWLFVACFMAAGGAQAEFKQSIVGNRNIYEVSIDAVEQTQRLWFGETFVSTKLQGVDGYSGIIHKEGDPEIPVVRFYVEGDGQITVLPGSEVEELPPLEEKVFPTQMSFSKAPHAPISFSFNATSYEQDEFTPAFEYQISDAGSVRSVKRRLVTLVPYTYNPYSGEQRLRKSFQVVVERSGLTGKPERLDRQTIVLVVGKKFTESAALASYVEHKRRQGYLVYQEVVGEKLKSAAAIRERLRTYYQSTEHDLKHVILVGDIQDVPAFDAQNLTRESYILLFSVAKPTDHYYRLLDTEDISSDIGAPDVELGRISVSNEAELATVVDKYTRYDLGQFANDEWLSKSSFIATDDKLFFDIVEGTHDHATEFFLGPKAYQGNFPSPAFEGGDRLYAIRHEAKKEDLVQAVSEGRGIINYSGHGGLDRWVAPNFTPGDLDKIASPDALPVVISNACITGQFSQTVVFGEAWQRHPKGGVFFWGSIDNTFWNEDDLLERKFYELAMVQGQQQLGALTSGALADVWRFYGGEGRSRYYWETYESFGDPSMNLRIAKTAQPHLWGPRVLPRAAESLSFRVTNERGEGLAKSRVVAAIGPYRYLGVADTQGVAKVPVNPNLMRRGQPVDVHVSGSDLRQTRFALRVGWLKI